MIANDLIHFAEAMFVAISIGYFVVDLLFPRHFPRLLVWAFAPLTGFGICAFIVFLFRRPMFTVEAVVFVVLLFLWIRYRRPWFSQFTELRTSRFSIFAVLFALILGWALSVPLTRVDRYPNGMTDGWAIWNSHAKYLAAGGSTWKQDLQNTYHPDYPLLVPGIIVHAWRFIGSKPPDVPGFMGILFAFSGIGILAASLSTLRTRTIGILMGFVLVGTPFYLYHAATGYAEVPLSVYMLSTIALILLYDNEPSKPIGIIVLAGFMAGCAAWTKNEGVPFLLLTSGVLLVTVFRMPSITLRRFAGYAAGIAVPLAAIAYFKLTTQRPTDLFEDRNSVEMMAKAMNPERYIFILKTFFKTGRIFGGWAFNPYIPILAFVGFTGVDRSILKSFSWRAGIAIVAMMLMTYYAIYIITPLDLNYHLDSSLDRLLLHLWPTCLLLIGVTVRKPAFTGQQADAV